MSQATLFDADGMPEGFVYRPEMISASEEQTLSEIFGRLPLEPFEFHGFLGKRRIASFGFRYDYSARSLRESAALPDFLLPLREKAAAFAAVNAQALAQVLVTEYAAGAGIGWHRDKPDFRDVVAFSFLESCTLRFRRKRSAGWERRSLTLMPRSAYLLRGPARWEWEHSIPEVPRLRYSVTFRNFNPPSPA